MTAEDNEAAMQTAARSAESEDPPPPTTLADEHRAMLSSVSANGDRTAFKTLFVYFGPRIKSLMMKAGAEPAMAEDLVQDVMTKVWRKCGQYAADKGTVSTWIFTIARNARIDRLRRATSRPYQDIDDLEIASDEVPNDERTDMSKKAERVTIAVAALPEDQKLIVDLAFMQDKSQSEISDQLSIPLGTVKSRLRLAYSKLKENLEDLR